MTGLVQAFGSGAMTNSIEDITEAKAILAIGTNTTEQHPVISLAIKRAVRKHGAQLVSDEVVRYEDTYRLCYIRGPEGLLIGLAEEIG